MEEYTDKRDACAVNISPYMRFFLSYLHDVVEDPDWTFDALLDEGFPERIVEALRCVTKLSDNEPYDEFIERVKTNSLAIAVKINDLTDNMDVRRYKELTEWDVKRLRNYLKAYHELTKE